MPKKELSEEDKKNYEMYKSGQIKKPIGKRFDIVDQTKLSGKYLMKSLMEISIRRDINVIFCDNKYNAFIICNSIFKRLNELFNGTENDS